MLIDYVLFCGFFVHESLKYCFAGEVAVFAFLLVDFLLRDKISLTTFKKRIHNTRLVEHRSQSYA